MREPPIFNDTDFINAPEDAISLSKLENINLSLSSLTKINSFLVKNVVSKYYNKKITFKSPNDLLIKKKKICGILQEKIEKSKIFTLNNLAI